MQQADEGTGPPLHSHKWDESFYVLKDQVEEVPPPGPPDIPKVLEVLKQNGVTVAA